MLKMLQNTYATHVSNTRQTHTVTGAIKEAIVTCARSTCKPAGEHLWYCTTLSYAAMEYGASAKHLCHSTQTI